MACGCGGECCKKTTILGQGLGFFPADTGGDGGGADTSFWDFEWLFGPGGWFSGGLPGDSGGGSGGYGGCDYPDDCGRCEIDADYGLPCHDPYTITIPTYEPGPTPPFLCPTSSRTRHYRRRLPHKPRQSDWILCPRLLPPNVSAINLYCVSPDSSRKRATTRHRSTAGTATGTSAGTGSRLINPETQSPHMPPRLHAQKQSVCKGWSGASSANGGGLEFPMVDSDSGSGCRCNPQ